MVANTDLSTPDLIPMAIKTIPLSPIEQGNAAIIQVVINNQGSQTATDFWVDLYINPIRGPKPQDAWQYLCANPWPNANCLGAAWHVTQLLLPGQSLTLTTQTQITDSAYSHWLGYFNVAGQHSLYVQVDSFGDDGDKGNIDERDEQNNVLGPIGLLITERNISLGLPPLP